MPKPQPSEAWYAPAIEIMLEERMTLLQAVSVLGVALSPEEAANHQRRQSFRDLHARMTTAFYELKSNTTFGRKEVLLGWMLNLAEGLQAQGRLKEAADVLSQYAKAQGWVGGETTVNLYQQLSGADLTKAIADIRARREAENTKVN